MKNVKRKTIAVWEIALMISFSFAFSFILGESFGFGVGVVMVSAEPPAVESLPPAPTYGPTSVPAVASSTTTVPANFHQWFVGSGRTAGTTIVGGIDIPASATGHYIQSAGFSDGIARNIIQYDPTSAFAFDGSGGMVQSTWSSSANSWVASSNPVDLTALSKTNLGSAYYPGMTDAEFTTLGWNQQPIGLEGGKTATAWVSQNGQGTTAIIQGPNGAQQATWNAAANGGQGAWTGVSTTGGYQAQGTLGSLLTGNALASPVLSALLSGAIWGAAVGGIAYGLALMFGQNKDQAASIGLGAGAGTFVGTTAYFLAQNGVLGPALQASGGALLGLGLGLGVGAAIIILTYKKQKKELVRFECLPWEPPRGGANCDVCNEDETKPCSEYRCKSLGAGCELINQGSKEEKCVWITKGDTAAPHMEPSQEALTNGLSYIPDSAISPPNRGFKIIDHTGDECLQPFTNLEFGITTDEPAQCKLDLTPKATFDEMQFLFGDSNLFLEEHKQKIKVPSPFTETGENVPEIGIDGTFTLWARCIDANGNGKDSAMVAFRYCVDPAPDTTQPVVTSTSVTSSSYVGFNADKVPVEVYVNEPAECRWSRQDKDFDSMENTMTCATESYQINAELNYACSGDLTGIENKADNWFYFRCRDYSTAPGGRNTMTSSYPLLLRGTEELTITKVGPTGEFKGSASVVTVDLTAETAHGAEEGKAICYFDTEEDGNFEIAMDNTNSYQHNQSLDLGAGNYIYYFRCIDAGGNSASANTNFTVTVDTTLPSVTRVLKDGNLLKVITSEEAKCAYSETSCNFNLEEGIALTYENPTVRIVHTAEWKDAITYYIKCEDLMGNQPRPDYCHMIVKASEL